MTEPKWTEEVTVKRPPSGKILRFEEASRRTKQWFSGDTAQITLKGWRLGLFLAGSAAFGGIAVALWNRRALSEIRSKTNSPSRAEDPEYRED